MTFFDSIVSKMRLLSEELGVKTNKRSFLKGKRNHVEKGCDILLLIYDEEGPFYTDTVFHLPLQSNGYVSQYYFISLQN